MHPDKKSVIRQLETLFENHDRIGYLTLAAELTREADVSSAAIIAAYNARWELEDIAAAHRLDDRFRPRVWWMRQPFPGNFGDILTPYVLWHAFGVMPRLVPAREAQGLCIGSIARLARPGSLIWGTGMPRPDDPLAADAVWSAVRGPMSRAAVLAAGGEVPAIYGDGAVLLPEIYAPSVEKTHRIGIIPHVSQEAHLRASLADAGLSDQVRLISLLTADFAGIERVIREILSCDEIVSTSLHGLIVSHAYGVPCQSARLMLENSSPEDSFKMLDYKASVGLGPEDGPLHIPAEFTTLEWLADRRCVLPPHPIDTVALRAAFPFDTPARPAPARSSDMTTETKGRLLDKLAALMATGHRRRVETFATRLMGAAKTGGQQVRILKQLADGGHADMAARLFVEQTSLRTHPSFVRLGRLIQRQLQGTQQSLVAEIDLAMSAVLGIGELPPTLESEEFTFRPAPPQTQWGRITLGAAATVPPHHLPTLAARGQGFLEALQEQLVPAVVNEFHDVFTDYLGKVWTPGGRIIHHISPRKYHAAWHPADAPDADRPLAFNPAPTKEIGLALAVNRATCGIYHWIVDYLPTLAFLTDRKARGEAVPQILVNGTNPGFEREFLDWLGLTPQVVAVAPGDTIRVERLLLPNVRLNGFVGWSHLDSVFQPLIAHALAEAARQEADLPERIYITRSQSPRRSMANEAAVEDLARARGFAVVDFAEIPLWRQVAMARRAKVIMGPHGAGLSHLIFAEPGTRVIELLPIKDGTYNLRFNYARLSLVKGHDYRGWLQPQNLGPDGWETDLEGFGPFLDQALDAPAEAG